jgi:hypothetical protein
MRMHPNSILVPLDCRRRIGSGGDHGRQRLLIERAA